jgi:hypothetical protein
MWDNVRLGGTRASTPFLEPVTKPGSALEGPAISSLSRGGVSFAEQELQALIEIRR